MTTSSSSEAPPPFPPPRARLNTTDTAATLPAGNLSPRRRQSCSSKSSSRAAPRDRSGPRIVARGRTSTSSSRNSTSSSSLLDDGDDGGDDDIMDNVTTTTKQQTKRRWMAAAADHHDRRLITTSRVKEVTTPHYPDEHRDREPEEGNRIDDHDDDNNTQPTQQQQQLIRNDVLLQPLPTGLRLPPQSRRDESLSRGVVCHDEAIEMQQRRQQRRNFNAPPPPPPPPLMDDDVDYDDDDDDITMPSLNDNETDEETFSSTNHNTLEKANIVAVADEGRGEGDRDRDCCLDAVAVSDFEVKKKHSMYHDSTEGKKRHSLLLGRVLRSTIRSPLLEETTNNDDNHDDDDDDDEKVDDDEVVDDLINWQSDTGDQHHHAAHDDMSRSDVSSLTEAVSVSVVNEKKSRLWNPFASSPIVEHNDAPTTIVTTTPCCVGTPPRHPSRTSSRSPTPVVTNNNNPVLAIATALLRSLSPSNSSRGVGGIGGGGGVGSSSGGSYSSRGGGSTNGSGGGGRGGGSSTVTRGGGREYDVLTSASSFPPTTPGGKTSSGSHSSSLERAINATSIQNTDRSLETRLYENGSKRNLFDNILGRVRTTSGDIVVGSRQHRALKSEQLSLPLEGRGMATAIYVSPLGRAIDQERITTSPGGSPQRIGSIVAGGSPSKETRQYQTVVAVPRHRRVQSGIPGSGSISMKIPPPMPLHQRSGTQGNIRTPSSRTSTVGVDLMDVACDAEPVDPFSGLIGMHHSIVACEDNEASHLFGIPTLSKSTSSGTFLSDDGTPRSLHSSSQDGSSGQSPVVRPSSSGEFDPLLEGQQQHTIKEEWNSPARHYKDDPLLANSRYRYPSWTGPKQSPKKKTLHKPPLTHRTSSSGSECMLGKITQLEVGKLPAAVSELTLIGEEFVESTTMNNFNLDDRQSTASFLDEVVIATNTTSLTTHDTTTSTIRGENNNDGGDNKIDYDDNSSVQSFSDEFRRHNKGIKQEVKLIVNPFVTKGRKLLRRTSDNAALKRSDGCLT